MKRTSAICSLFLLLASPAMSAEGPTFDCAKASHDIEVLICQEPDLAALDRRLAETYQAALAALSGVADSKQATNELKAYQRGWIGGRNECWKADDKRACTEDSYNRQITWLQARYMLVKASDPVFYTCNGNPADEIVATFMDSTIPSARLERGDTTEIALLTPSASGSRYEADFGVTFWIKGNEAQVAWPQDTSFTCIARQ